MTRGVTYRRTDPYGTERPPFEVVAEFEVAVPPTPEQRAAARAKIERDEPAGYSHAARLTLA